MLHLYYGREDRDSYGFFFAQIAERLKAINDTSAGPLPRKLYLIVPDQFTHQIENNALEALQVPGLMDLEVLSFTRLGYKLLEENGGGIRVPIDKDGRCMLLSRIAAEQKEGLQAFGKLSRSAAFAERLDAIISEFKQYGTSPEALEEAAAKAGQGSFLQRKLSDIALVYRRYNDEIAGKYLDTEDYMDLFARKAEASRFVQEGEFWIAGFDPFSPKIEQLAGILMARSKAVHLVVTAADGRAAGERDSDLFGLSRYFLRRMTALADSLGVAVDLQPVPDAFARKRPAALEHLERELYAHPYRAFAAAKASAPAAETGAQKGQAGALAPIALCRAGSPYAEIEAAAARITELVRDHGYRYRELAVLCNDMEGRGPLVKRVFGQYGIPVFMDQKKKILQNPAVVFVLALLDVVCDGSRYEDVFRLIKSGFTAIGTEDRETLENYCIKYRVKGKAWNKPFTYGAFEYGEKTMAHLNVLREKFAALVEAFASPFKEAKTAGQRTRILYDFLAETAKLPQKIDDLREALTEEGQLEDAAELAQVWDALVHILDQLVELAGNEPLSVEEYRTLLEAGLASVEIGLIPPAADQVVVGPARRLATGRLRALFVIGANEGLLPAESAAKDLLSHSERELLLSRYEGFCKNEGWIAEEERLAIYRDLAKPEEYLWVSCSLAGSDGGGTRPSEIFLKLQELFPEVPVEQDLLNQDTFWDRLQTAKSSLPHLAQAMITAKQTGVAADWQQVYNWYLQEAPELLAPVQQGLLFRPGRERISKERAAELYSRPEKQAAPSEQTGAAAETSKPSGAAPETAPASISISPSRLERFSRCPFSHFITYGLRPEERREFGVSGREAGDVYHECLMELSRRLSRGSSEVTAADSLWMRISDEDLQALVREILQKVAGSYREGVLSFGEEEKYRTGRLEEVLQIAAAALVNQVRQGKVQQMFLEEPFGRKALRLPAIPVKTDSGTVYLEGRIDRVDILPGGYVKIIDYKSGNENFDTEEARKGWRLQLLLYLRGAMGEENWSAWNHDLTAKSEAQDEPEAQGEPEVAEKHPGAVLYFRIQEPSVDVTAKPAESQEMLSHTVERELRKALSMNGIALALPEVLDSLAGNGSPDEVVESMRVLKDGSLSGKALLDEGEFRKLLAEVTERVETLCKQLVSGDAAASPMQSGQQSACTYCQYKSICNFEITFDGCRFRMVK